jgi:ABC-type bacteriocin/lantibiotic exporter with double-glycine peptidase domain
MISNRLWHLQLCNKIYVLNEGKITQSGTIDEMKNVQGFFKDTYEKQRRIMSAKFA